MIHEFRKNYSMFLKYGISLVFKWIDPYDTFGEGCLATSFLG